MFTNLLSNALKFTRIRKNAKIEIGSMTEDGHTVFFIKDKLVNHITVARDGEEALDIIFQSGKESAGRLRPDLILLDLKLPKVDGMDVLRQIKENSETKVIPVIILTSSKEENDLAESYRLGVNSYIRKPVNFEKFTEVVMQLGLYWLLINEPPPQKQ